MKMSYWAEQHITPLLGMLGDEVFTMPYSKLQMELQMEEKVQ
jgi:hypothetical protein